MLCHLESNQPLEGDDYLKVTIEDMNGCRLSHVYTTYLAHGALFSDKPKISSIMSTGPSSQFFK